MGHKVNLINENELSKEIARTRKIILDMLEIAFGDHPRWPMVRTSVLRALGKSGLEGIIERLRLDHKEILSKLGVS